MGQIGSIMVSVCTIWNIFWDNYQRVNAVSDNIIIHVSHVFVINCTIWPEESTVQCQIRSSLGQWCAISPPSKVIIGMALEPQNIATLYLIINTWLLSWLIVIYTNTNTLPVISFMNMIIFKMCINMKKSRIKFSNSS